MWDAGLYLKYAEERSRPFFDLVARVNKQDVHRIADLGCGPGNLTRTLCDRWPAALVVGVDNSVDMLERTQSLAISGRLEFVLADIAAWSPELPLDLILSNAALQWLGDHEALLRRLTGLLAPNGTLAVQMPYHFQHAAHLAIEETKADPRWRDTLQGVGLNQQSVMPLVWYVERLHDLRFTVEAWETTYIHVLAGENPVLEWYKGTALRPLLSQLDEQAREAFLNQLSTRLKAAYPARAGITLLPFPRIFFIATRSD
jgi:trans-aconitate 2-methyltransferase